MEISDWRKRIDEVDQQLIHLLGERASFALEIGRIKQHQGLPVYDASREAAILDRLCNMNQGPLPNESIRKIYTVLMEETRKVEHSLQDL